MQAETDLLPDLQGIAHPQHPQPGYGEGGIRRPLPLQGTYVSRWQLLLPPVTHLGYSVGFLLYLLNSWMCHSFNTGPILC